MLSKRLDCDFVPFCLGGSRSLGIPGCGAFNCLEETWEERWYRKRGKEGGRAQYGAGTFERNSFTLASHPATGRAV